MKATRRTLIAATLLAPAVARAQAPWTPTRPTRFVVPFPAGGATDVVARVLAERMQESLRPARGGREPHRRRRQYRRRERGRAARRMAAPS